MMKILKKINKKIRKSSKIQKILAGSLILAFLGSLFPLTSFGNQETHFVVTAYYSPLPDQKFYLTGDYKKEKRLNGQGIRGASGKPVFSGMLAGPKLYSFGTKIQLEGLGVGVIEDRGGAIVPAGQRGYSYNRIDVWVGYGDEGLRRALYWGKRTIKGKVLSNSAQSTLDYNTIPAPLWATKAIKQTKKPNTLFQTPIGKNSKTSDIKKLQSFFKEIDLYSGEISGIYNSKIMDIILEFQKSNNIISKDTDFGAAYWGGKTRSLFLKKYLNGEFDTKIKSEKTVKNIKLTNTVTEEKVSEIIIENELTEKKIKEQTKFFSFPVISQDERKELQSRLTQLGYYNGKINGDKNDSIDAIFEFQVNSLIVNTQYDIGAGTYGPKTREAMRTAYIIYLKEQEEKRQEKLKIKKEKLEGEKRKKDLEEKRKKLEELSLKQAQKIVAMIGKPKFGDTSPKVRELQKTLVSLGYLDKHTAYFGNQTKEALMNLQADNKLISSDIELGAGIFGPKTRETMIQILYKKELTKQVFVGVKI